MARRRFGRFFCAQTCRMITLGLAWLSGAVGSSLALGAFLAGMLPISETEYRYQVEEDIALPRRAARAFFVTVGMLLDVAEIVRNLPAGARSAGAPLVLVRAEVLRPRAFVRRYQRARRCARL